jgi:hypothetical protein
MPKVLQWFKTGNYKVFKKFMNSYKFPLVRPACWFHFDFMSRVKTLSALTFTGVIAMTALPATADLLFSASTNKSYRASQAGLTFSGGTFDVNLRDGNATFVAGCRRTAYWRPNIPLDPCPLGSTGYLLFGNLEEQEASFANYYSIVSVIPALVIEPKSPLGARLIAAPASKLARPSGGFTDLSYGLYYNLHNGSAPEYSISRYSKSDSYSSTQRSKFESEIVRGVYQYVFPRLRQPTVPAPLKATIFQMAEGTAKLNNQVTGFDFAGILKTKFIQPGNLEGLPAGFVEFSQSRPNTVNWKGLTPSNVFAGVDRLYMSIRRMVDTQNPTTTTLDLIDDATRSPAAVFPPYLTGLDPRTQLPSPYSTSFAFPPLLRGGSRGMLQLELGRSFNTGGAAYDFSSRKFEVPIVVVNRYTDFALTNGITKADILDDSDGDGFNNMTEWILDSSPRFAGSTPEQFRAINHAIEYTPIVIDDQGGFFIFSTEVKEKQYFGFTVDQKLQTIPSVQYTLQRSFDGGRTWSTFVSDSKWNVFTQVYSPGQRPVLDETDTAGRVRIRVESKYDTRGRLYDPLFADFITQGPPPGIENETYRVKITR